MPQELEKCKQRFKQILGALPCAYIFGEVIVDGKGDAVDYAVKDVNHAFTDLTGLSRERITGKRISGLFSISSVQDDISVVTNVALTGDPVEKEFQSPFFGMHLKLFCFSPEKGTFVALISDLTQEKKYQERVQFLRDFANSTSDEFYILDPSGKFVLGNIQTANRLGVPESKVAGHHISELNPIADGDWWNTLWNSLLQKGSLQFETEHVDTDGELYPVELSADLMINGKRKYAAMVAKNISSKRTLSSALLKDQRYAEKAAAVAGYFIWMIDQSGVFRPLIGGGGRHVSGPMEEVFLANVHTEDRSKLSHGLRTKKDGTVEFRMKTAKGILYHRAVWSRIENSCITGVCYPLSGAGLAGLGSESAAMDTYCLMTEAVYRKLTKMKDALETSKLGVVTRTLRSITSEFSSLTGQSVFPERVRFDSFLSANSGMFKQLLEPAVQVDIDSSVNCSGLIDPTFLENVLVRILLVIQKTEIVEKVLIRSDSGYRDAGIRISISGREGIQSELEKYFIPVNDTVPGLASVYAMVRSSGGRVAYESHNSIVQFELWFPKARMSDEAATILIALPGSVDAARSYAALRDAGYSVAIENSSEEIIRRFSGDRTGILIMSDSMPDFTSQEISSALPNVTIVTVGGEPGDNREIWLPDGFKTSELVACIKQLALTAETPLAEDLQGGILWGEPHLTPPLS